MDEEAEVTDGVPVSLPLVTTLTLSLFDTMSSGGKDCGVVVAVVFVVVVVMSGLGLPTEKPLFVASSAFISG